MIVIKVILGFIGIFFVIQLLSYITGTSFKYVRANEPFATPNFIPDFLKLIRDFFLKIFSPKGYEKRKLRKELKSLELQQFDIFEKDSIRAHVIGDFNYLGYTKEQKELVVEKIHQDLMTKRQKRIYEIEQQLKKF